MLYFAAGGLKDVKNEISLRDPIRDRFRDTEYRIQNTQLTYRLLHGPQVLFHCYLLLIEIAGIQINIARGTTDPGIASIT